MASCAVPDCLNNKKKSNKSFFRLPKDKSTQAAWITRLNRVDKLPLEVWVCEDHFTSDCFDISAELKRKYVKPGICIVSSTIFPVYWTNVIFYSNSQTPTSASSNFLAVKRKIIYIRSWARVWRLSDPCILHTDCISLYTTPCILHPCTSHYLFLF